MLQISYLRTVMYDAVCTHIMHHFFLATVLLPRKFSIC